VHIDACLQRRGEGSAKRPSPDDISDLDLTVGEQRQVPMHEVATSPVEQWQRGRTL
jgi:hypothetical protein